VPLGPKPEPVAYVHTFLTSVVIEPEIAEDVTPSARMMFYERIRQEHWLRDKQDDGKCLILNDDSSWEVHPSERVITARWLRGSTIIVEYTEKGAYPYLLRNLTEEEVARANFLGEFRAVS
jgi:hypothetical protein